MGARGWVGVLWRCACELYAGPLLTLTRTECCAGLDPGAWLYAPRLTHTLIHAVQDLTLVPGYDGCLLRLAADLGDRLAPAFETGTGIPLSWINLRKVIQPPGILVTGLGSIAAAVLLRDRGVGGMPDAVGLGVRGGGGAGGGQGGPANRLAGWLAVSISAAARPQRQPLGPRGACCPRVPTLRPFFPPL